MKIEIKNESLKLGEDKTISLEIEPIYWATGKTTYHIYINSEKYKIFKGCCSPENEILNCNHLIITDLGV